MTMVTVTAATQTVLNFELILHFLYNDLPRLISYDIVPLFFKVINNVSENSELDINISLQKQVEGVVKSILKQGLPKPNSINLPFSIDKQVIKCNICQHQFKVIQHLAEHLLDNHTTLPSTSAIALDCFMCSYTTQVPTDLGKHLKEKHVENYDDLRATPKLKVDTIECPVCRQTFSSYPKLVLHLAGSKHPQPHTSEVQCKFCRFTTLSPTELGRHIDVVHVQCNRQSDAVKGARGGGGKTRTNVTYQCNICNVNFFCVPSFTKHKATHRKDIPKCPKCDVLFEFQSQLTSHLKFSTTCGSVMTPKVGHSSEQPDTVTLAPSVLKIPAPSTQQRQTANMIGTALLDILDGSGGGGEAPGASNQGPTNAANDSTLPVTFPVVTLPVTVPAMQTITPSAVSEKLIMDTTTGRPIPVSEYLQKHPHNTGAASKPRQLSVRKYKCDQCGRAFGSLSVLNHHQVKMHFEKKFLSCTQCTKLFASFAELESHFYRVHKNNRQKSAVVLESEEEVPDTPADTPAPSDDFSYTAKAAPTPFKKQKCSSKSKGKGADNINKSKGKGADNKRKGKEVANKRRVYPKRARQQSENDNVEVNTMLS